MAEHHYKVKTVWTGNQGKGTLNYHSYTRDHEISSDGKPVIQASSDPAFRGDRSKYNPEELLVSSISSCHMLWYLHLCAVNDIVVTSYADQAKGTMVESDDGGGRFKEVTLYREVTITDQSKISKAIELHREAHRLCFIANSCNFPITHDPVIKVE